MRNRIFGIIGILWGGGVIVSFFARGGQVGTGSYAIGTLTGLLFGAVMLIYGVYYTFKGDK